MLSQRLAERKGDTLALKGYNFGASQRLSGEQVKLYVEHPKVHIETIAVGFWGVGVHRVCFWLSH